MSDLSLINTLLSIANTEPEAQPDTILAKYFLENYCQIHSLNIYTVTMDCAVSRSSVYRFCQRIGFQNFRDLKDQLDNVSDASSYYSVTMSSADYIQQHKKALITMLNDFDELIPLLTLRDIARRIYESEQVVLISNYSYRPALIQFQRPLILQNKYITVYDSNHVTSAQLQYLSKNAVIIVVSNNTFTAENYNLLKQINAYKILLTDSYHDNQKLYNQVCHLSKENIEKQKSGTLKYGSYYFFDCLLSVYLQKYPNRI